jgi:hypothetical protein
LNVAKVTPPKEFLTKLPLKKYSLELGGSMMFLEILLIGLPILIALFGLGLYWILEHDLKRPMRLEALSATPKENFGDLPAEKE